MDSRNVKGLIGSVGKKLALAPLNEQARERLETIGSREEFRSFLEGEELGIDEEAKSGFIEAVTGEDWRDFHSQLSNSTDRQWHEYKSPSA